MQGLTSYSTMVVSADIGIERGGDMSSIHTDVIPKIYTCEQHTHHRFEWSNELKIEGFLLNLIMNSTKRKK